MIVTTAIILFLLIIATWIASIYVSWQQEEHTLSPVVHLPSYADKSARLMRRGWFAVIRAGKVSISWMSKHIALLFYKIFPKAKSAFMERDTLSGLDQGPTSYFLKSISEDARPTPKAQRRSKKVL